MALPLLLPVLHRVATPSDAMDISTPDSEGTKPMSPTRSSSLASTSASSEIHYVVKNTFIDVSPAGSEEDTADMAFHYHGARTCLARIASDDSEQQLLERISCVEAPHEASPVAYPPTPQFHSDVASLGLRDPRLLFASSFAPATDEDLGPGTPASEASPAVFTPTPQFHNERVGLGLRDPRQLLAASLAPAVEDEVGQMTPPPPPAGTPAPAAQKVLLQIPLELAGGAAALEAVQVDVQEGTVDAATGNLIVSLRVTLAPPSGCAAIASDVKLSGSVVPQQPSTPAADAPVPPSRSSVVCRHWKNKGWCNYRDSCKFQHPASLRGVDVPAAQHLPVPPARRRSRDCRPQYQSPHPVPVGRLQ